MTVINTGNMKLRNLTIVAPDWLTSVGSCNVPDFNNGSFTLPAYTQMSCSASVIMTQADIETAYTRVAVEVVATSMLGATISSLQDVYIRPMQVPQLSVALSECGPAPTKPGTGVTCSTARRHNFVQCCLCAQTP
jgi:hypothetical protein